ncbi:MAG: LamG-like jellyroll fold domain-containing protein [Bryobacteraceae bacterium]
MAVALSWNGFVDTDLSFSEFFSSNHTLACRFMPQYPHAYEGPIIAENGTGFFMLGQADYNDVAPMRKIRIAFGSRAMTYSTPQLRAGQWAQLVVAATVTPQQWSFLVYLNGEPLNTFVVPAGTTGAPSGKLRFGKRTTGQLVKGRNVQFYGLVDDVAVFSHAMPPEEVKHLYVHVKQLTGNEPGLLAGYTFAENPTHPRLKRPISFHGAAHRVDVTTNRSSPTDATLLPLPTQHQPMDLPFRVGDVWRVVKGHDTENDHHSGYASFTLDFVIDAEKNQGDVYPNGTGGAPLHAAAGGIAARIRESEPPGTTTPNILEIEQAPNEFAGYFHLGQNSVPVNLNGTAVRGQQIGTASSTGMGGCTKCNHLHFGVADRAGEPSGFVTFPVAYSDYQVIVNGGWFDVPRGIPTLGQVVRNPPTPSFGPASLRPRSVVTRKANQLDVVATDVFGNVWANRWIANAFAQSWDRWRSVLPPYGTNHTPVEVVSRHPDKLDIFLTGFDRNPYTGAWEDGHESRQWMGFWKIQSLLVPDDAPVTAVARDPGKLDIFATGSDGGVYTAAWDANLADQGWQGWRRIGDLTVKPGSPVSAVSRDSNKLDIFVAGNDGKVYTAAWDAHAANQQWMGWWTILDAQVPAGAHVTAVSRHPNKLDVFVVASNQGAFTAAWELGVNGSQWMGWWRIGDEVFQPGIPITPVSRHPDNLDLFVAGNDGRVWTAAWAHNSQWAGWWTILDGRIAAGSAVAAVAMNPGKLDIFAVDPEGRMHTAAWDQNVTDSPWRGWWRIG